MDADNLEHSMDDGDGFSSQTSPTHGLIRYRLVNNLLEHLLFSSTFCHLVHRVISIF